MGWDPAVLRKYNTTGHFRLLSQLRSELKTNPLVRPKDGQTIGEVNRSKGLIRAMEANRTGRTRRSASEAAAMFPVVVEADGAGQDAHDQDSAAASFRDRLDAVDVC